MMDGGFSPTCTSVSQRKMRRRNYIAEKLLWRIHLLITNPWNGILELPDRHWKVKWTEGNIASKSVELINAN